MRKFYNVLVIRPKAVLNNLWAAGLCSKFPQLHAALQQALVNQPALSCSVMSRLHRRDKQNVELI
jgi:hypothetical protein